MPYVRAKAQDFYERLGGGVDSDLFRDTPSTSHHLHELVRPPFLTLPSLIQRYAATTP